MTTQAPETLVTCAAPYCGRSHDAFAELVALDFPDKPVLLFCNIKCLWVWLGQEIQNLPEANLSGGTP